MLRHSLIAVILLLGAPASANDIFGRAYYGPLTLLRSIGYHDHARNDGAVSVEATSFPQNGRGFATRMAFYRAAELAHAQGHRYFQILKSAATIGTGMMNRDQEQISMIVRFADTPAAPVDCRQGKRAIDGCRTFDGALVMARLAKEMGQPQPELPADLKQADPRAVASWETVTTVRFAIDEQGQPSDCAIEQSTAPEPLARAACRTILNHGHYRPALGPDGRPQRSLKTVRFVWRIDGGKQIEIAPPLAPSKAVLIALPPKATPNAPPPAAPKKIYPNDDTIQTPL